MDEFKEKVIDYILDVNETRVIHWENCFDSSQPESIFNTKGVSTTTYKGITEACWTDEDAIIIDGEYFDLYFSREINIVSVSDQGKNNEIIRFPFTHVLMRQRRLKLEKLELI